MKDLIIDVRGLGAFGGSRWRKLLWAITSFDRPFIWLLPIAASLVILVAPSDVLSRVPWLGDACNRLAGAIPLLRHAPPDSPFPQVIQLATCLAFVLLCIHVVLATVLAAVVPFSTAVGVARLQFMGQSVSTTLFAGFVCLLGGAAGALAIVTADSSPGVYLRSFRSSRFQVAFLFGFGPMIYSLALMMTARLLVHVIHRRRGG